jgi:hypothetical protein
MLGSRAQHPLRCALNLPQSVRILTRVFDEGETRMHIENGVLIHCSGLASVSDPKAELWRTRKQRFSFLETELHLPPALPKEC